jgi:nickel transport protein
MNKLFRAGMRIRWVAWIFGFVLVGLLCDATISLAHRVIVFAWVDGDTVYVECKYSGGRKVRNGQIIVLDTKGRTLLQGKTDDRGQFAFNAPEKQDLKIVLNAGMGHRAEWLVEGEEFLDQGVTERSAIPKAKSKNGSIITKVSSESTQEVHAIPGPNALEIQKLVEQSLNKKLAPILKILAENEDRGASMTDVIGGIGYIFGLIGVAAYFSSRRKRT